MTIELPQDGDIRAWMINVTNQRISLRVRLTFIAQDMDVDYHTLLRFMNNDNVTGLFYIKWFKWYAKGEQ